MSGTDTGSYDGKTGQRSIIIKVHLYGERFGTQSAPLCYTNNDFTDMMINRGDCDCMKKYLLTGIIAFVFACSMMTGCELSDDASGYSSEHLSSTEDIGLYDRDGGGVNYAFSYQGEEFYAQYYYDNWTLFDSYKITDKGDMEIICQALIDTHTVHGSDYESFRTADDMVYEWQQHNLAYTYLPEDNGWRESAKNVDFDPQDQGKSFEEMYESRTGQELDLKEKVKEGLESGEIFEKLEQVIRGE